MGRPEPGLSPDSSQVDASSGIWLLGVGNPNDLHPEQPAELGGLFTAGCEECGSAELGLLQIQPRHFHVRLGEQKTGGRLHPVPMPAKSKGEQTTRLHSALSSPNS